ncbi:hypothetical protein NE1936 [Nitrosomonas europaea ATCC 19718]|uniref:Uncharacterized protein n=1 Tax=Nitrosomonas europaea (strain ATCC 19718 / CIP 103999 / KCTC 2705 / NBRC 14298) TaxID=228410 RepID=Q82TF2_NITEU|nr:hypothetical protein NE1936 [Nitrosomonas europaea ATCC 19718]
MRAASCSMFSQILKLILRTGCDGLSRRLGQNLTVVRKAVKLCLVLDHNGYLSAPASLSTGKVVEVKVDEIMVGCVKKPTKFGGLF